MAKPWRPTIDDVDSISRGGPAKVRGTGSRRIPHRLNAEERTLYDIAKKKGFVAVRGTGYRKFRHGNPLPNIYRQWCDARAQLCVVVEQDLAGGSGVDQVVVDLAPLRLEDTSRVESALLELAAELGVRRVGYEERPADALPFNILPPDEGEEWGGSSSDDERGPEAGGAAGVASAAAAAGAPSGAQAAAAGADPGEEAVGSTSGAGSGGEAADAAVLALRQAAAQQAGEVRRLKEAEGRGNQDAAVQEAVQLLLRLKAELGSAEAPQAQDPAPHTAGRQQQQPDDAPAAAGAATPGAAAAGPRASPLEHYYSLPIWQIHAVPLFFECERAAAKLFAGAAVKRIAESARALARS